MHDRMVQPCRVLSAGVLVVAALTLGASTGRAEGLLNAACAPGQKLIVQDYKDPATSRTPRGHAMAAFTRGKNAAGVDTDYMMMVWSQDSGKGDGGISFWNWDNPQSWSQPRLKKHFPAPVLREAHSVPATNLFGGDWRTFVLQATSGFSVLDLDSVASPKLLATYAIAGAARGGKGSPASCRDGCSTSYDAAARDYTEGAVWFIALAAPYIYVAQADNGLNIYRFTSTSNGGQIAWVKRLDKSWFGHRVNQVWVMGNLLVATASQLAYGVTLADISDPANPVRKNRYDLGTSPFTRETYSWTLNGTRLYGAARFKYRLNDPGLQVYAIDGNAFSLRHVGGVRGSCGAGGYASVQDRHAHTGLSTCYQRFDTGTLTPSSPTNPPWTIGITGADHDFTTPFANTVLVGNDHQSTPGSMLLCHTAARDTTRPSVNGQMPPKGAGGIKVTTGLGISFTDNLKPWTIGTGTLPIRRRGTIAAVPGHYSYQLNIVNFRPAAALARGTTYDVVVTSGVKDLAGNGAASYSGSFQTASAVNAVVSHDPEPREWTVRADLQAGARLFGGRDARVVDVPDRLKARSWISSDSGSHGFPAGRTLLSFELSEATEVQVCHDERQAEPPAWLAEWRDTGAGIAVAEGGESWRMACFARTYPAGEVRLGGPGGASEPYLVAFAPPHDEVLDHAAVSSPPSAPVPAP